MPYLEHTKALLALQVIEQENWKDKVEEIEVGQISALAHYFIQLDDDAEKVVGRSSDGITLRIHREWNEDCESNDQTISIKLTEGEVPVLRELLNKIEELR